MKNLTKLCLIATSFAVFALHSLEAKQVWTKNVEQKSVYIDAETVGDLKAKAAEAYHIPLDKLILVYKGQSLKDDSKTIDEAGIDDAVLVLQSKQ